MARWRKPRVIPRLAGTKSKWEHDSLHLVETARVKVRKARNRLPDHMTRKEQTEVRRSINALTVELDTLRRLVEDR